MLCPICIKPAEFGATDVVRVTIQSADGSRVISTVHRECVAVDLSIGFGVERDAGPVPEVVA